jgi:16S rRNA (cytidine1402-2'-O)-methyltransferase
MGTLYLVATPIGNLEDISARALRLLSEARLIAAEDTRQTLKLLNHFNIHPRSLVSYHEHNKLSRLEQILGELEQGDVALVSDAGTPALNDPGYELVHAALEAGYSVSSIPGASAPVAALVASGLPTDAFLYLGYLPRQPSERREAIQVVANLPYTLVFLESPHRLVDALSDLNTILGDRPAAVARELTKLHEEILRVTLSQALAHFEANVPRGEFTLVVGGQTAQPGPWNEQRLREAVIDGLGQGTPPSRLAARLANESGWKRREVYNLISQISKTVDE